MPNDIVLEISTEVTPAPKIKVDGVEYTLLSFDHLSPNEEAEASALFNRHQILLEEASIEKNTAKGKVIAETVRDARLRIICKFSDIPRDVVDRWPLGAQVKVLDAIRELTNREDEGGAAEPNDEAAPLAPPAPVDES